MPRMTQSQIDDTQRVREQLDAAIGRARADRRFSQRGRQQAIAAAYTAASRQMQAIAERFQTGVTRTTTDLSRDLFGAANVAAADAISARDADDRAARLENADQALALLQTAERNGDHILSRAIAARAFVDAQSFIGGTDWARVVNTYAGAHTDVADKMTRLAEAQRHDTADGLHNAAHTWLPKPTEIERLLPSQIDSLAAEDLDTIPPPTPNPPARVGNVWA